MNSILRWLSGFRMFGANAKWGHYVVLAIGTLPGLVDTLVFSVIPVFPTIAIITVLIIFPPFRLPAKGLDPHLERVELFVLTFGTFAYMGMFIGLGVGALVTAAVLDTELVDSNMSVSLSTLR